MSIALPRGILAVSIDLELDAQHIRVEQQRALDRVSTQLLDMLARHQVPATWNVADPAVSAATDKLVAAGIGHEVAVLGDQAWVGSDAGRQRFGRELQRRVMRGRELGLPLTTLALRGVNLDANLDLVVKHGITAVRGPEAGAQRKCEFNQPQSLYSGLWLMWPSLVLPGNNRWWPGGGRIGAAKRGLRQAAERREVFQLLINGLELTQRSGFALRGIEQVIRQAARLRAQRQLEIATLAGTVNLLSNLRQVTPARSILRPAA